MRRTYFLRSDYYEQREHYNGFLLMYIKSGKGNVFYEGEIYHAKALDVILIDCSKPYSYVSENWETLWMHFDGSTSSEFFNSLYQYKWLPYLT